MAQEYTINDQVDEIAPVETPVVDPALVAPDDQPPVEPVQPIVDTEDYKSKLADYERKMAEFEAWREAVTPELNQVQESRTKAVLDQVAAIVDKLEEINSVSDEPMTDTQLTAVRTLVGDGIRYRAIAENYTRQERAGTALHLAGTYLGPEATVKELQSLAKELYDLEDPRLMDRQLKILGKYKEMETAAGRRTAAVTRAPIDSPPPQAPIQSATASDFKVLELKVANRTATPDEMDRFAKLYAQARRGA